jgi:DNA-binding winged helix-turn-helix (wHTH) protein
MYTLTRSERIERSTSTHCPCCGAPLAADLRLRVDLGTNTVCGYGVAVVVPPRIAELCWVLADAYPNLVETQRIVSRIWGDQLISDSLLHVIINQTRRRLKRFGYSIENERGFGYRLLRMAVQS